MDTRLPIIENALDGSGGCGVAPPGDEKSRRSRERKRLPKWFKTSLPVGESQVRYNETKSRVNENSLNTVCEEARCPNVHDCWGRGTATFMIAGEVCTRGCRFCAIDTLCSDLDGDKESLALLLEGLPLNVFAHNVECVPRLDPLVRDPRASFKQSISILSEAKRIRPDILTKSSIMVGLGETDDEISDAMKELRSAGVDMITLGQYLQPGDRHLAVDRFPEPSSFAEWDREAREIGFSAVASGPLVRSSYRAGMLWEEARGGEPVVTRESTGSAVSFLSTKLIDQGQTI